MTTLVGSSELWGDESVARLCQIIVESNDGMVQQILEDRHDWLDLLSLEELERTDDLGLSLSFLVVYYDKPDSAIYLHKRGVDLGKPCDPIGFGTPMYYAVTLGKTRMVDTLDYIGYSITVPCETVFMKNAIYYAQKKDDVEIMKVINRIHGREEKSYCLFKKNFLKSKYRKLFLKKKRAAIKIQTAVRGRMARILFRAVKAGVADLDNYFGSVAESSQQDLSTVHEENQENGNEDDAEEADD